MPGRRIGGPSLSATWLWPRDRQPAAPALPSCPAQWVHVLASMSRRGSPRRALDRRANRGPGDAPCGHPMQTAPSKQTRPAGPERRRRRILDPGRRVGGRLDAAGRARRHRGCDREGRARGGGHSVRGSRAARARVAARGCGRPRLHVRAPGDHLVQRRGGLRSRSCGGPAQACPCAQSRQDPRLGATSSFRRSPCSFPCTGSGSWPPAGPTGSRQRSPSGTRRHGGAS